MTAERTSRRRSKRLAHGVELLDIPDVMTRLSCSERHVYRLITEGVLPAVNIAAPGASRPKTRVRSDDLDAYIDTATQAAHRLNSP